jgi:hypothetical protein
MSTWLIDSKRNGPEIEMSTNMQIANTIIEQLGGKGRLCAMTGAKDFVALERGLSFGVGKNAKGVNKVIIRLTDADLYDVEFGRVRTVKGMPTYKVLDSTEGAYADMLMDLFEQATGMYLTFAPRH